MLLAWVIITSGALLLLPSSLVAKYGFWFGLTLDNGTFILPFLSQLCYGRHCYAIFNSICRKGFLVAWPCSAFLICSNVIEPQFILKPKRNMKQHWQGSCHTVIYTAYMQYVGVDGVVIWWIREINWYNIVKKWSIFTVRSTSPSSLHPCHKN